MRIETSCAARRDLFMAPMLSARSGLAVLLMLMLILTLPIPARTQQFVFDGRNIERCIARTGAGNVSSCIGRETNRCIEKSEGGQSNWGIGHCSALEEKWWRGRLTKSLAAAQSRASQKDQGANSSKHIRSLTRSQKKWERTTTRKCNKAVAEMGGGSGAANAGISCSLGETARRVIYLDGLYQ